MLQNWKNITNLVKSLAHFNKKLEIKRTLSTTKNLFAKDDDKSKKKNKVKLYPGYQASNEEIQQALNEQSLNAQNIFGTFKLKIFIFYLVSFVKLRK